MINSVLLVSGRTAVDKKASYVLIKLSYNCFKLEWFELEWVFSNKEGDSTNKRRAVSYLSFVGVLTFIYRVYVWAAGLFTLYCNEDFVTSRFLT